MTLGAEFARVLVDSYSLPCDGDGRTPIDGDALGLVEGQPLFEVAGYATSFRLAARQAGYIEVYQSQSNDAAKTGADLFDIRGRVRSISVVHYTYDATGDHPAAIGTTSDATTINLVVGLLLDAPVGQRTRPVQGSPYRLTFTLDDGSTIERDYVPSTGAVIQSDSQEIRVPSTFREALESAVGATLAD